jgi:hypothetical protein
MNTPSAISHDLIRVAQAQTVRATRYTWHSATSQRRPGRWVADWFRRHLPTTPRRRPHLVPTDTAATRRHGRCAASAITVEPHLPTDVAVTWDELSVR